MDSGILCSGSLQLFTVAPSSSWVSSLVGDISGAQERIVCIGRALHVIELFEIRESRVGFSRITKIPGVCENVTRRYSSSSSFSPPPSLSFSPPPLPLWQKVFSLTKFQWFQGSAWCLLSADNTKVFHKGCHFLFIFGLVKLLILIILYHFTFFYRVCYWNRCPLGVWQIARGLLSSSVFSFSFSFARFHNYSEMLLEWHSAGDER